jgi:hypothetical protein
MQTQRRDRKVTVARPTDLDARRGLLIVVQEVESNPVAAEIAPCLGPDEQERLQGNPHHDRHLGWQLESICLNHTTVHDTHLAMPLVRSTSAVLLQVCDERVLSFLRASANFTEDSKKHCFFNARKGYHRRGACVAAHGNPHARNAPDQLCPVGVVGALRPHSVCHRLTAHSRGQ